MIPLVGLRARARAGARAGRCASRPRRASRTATTSSVGTMIELPRACFARRRDRAPRRVLLVRHQRPDADRARASRATTSRAGSSRTTWTAASSTRSPFETIDERGVGELVRMAVERGRAARPGPRARHLRRARRRPGLDPRSSTPPGSTTSAARRSACRSRASRPPRPRSRRRRRIDTPGHCGPPELRNRSDPGAERRITSLQPGAVSGRRESEVSRSKPRPVIRPGDGRYNLAAATTAADGIIAAVATTCVIVWAISLVQTRARGPARARRTPGGRGEALGPTTARNDLSPHARARAWPGRRTARPAAADPGRRSGRSRTTPVQYLADDDDVRRRGLQRGAARPPAWYLNLRANPHAQIDLRWAHDIDIRAHETTGQERATLWQR